MDVQKLSENERVKDILSILKDKALLMTERPMSLIKAKKLFRSTEVNSQPLVYREQRGDGFDGFFHALDPVSKIQRSKKKAAEGKGHEAMMKERKKYGQVAAVPNEWCWTFSWTTIKHPNLEKFLGNREKEFNFRHSLSEQRKELIDHLVAELFVYFRKGIPNYYLNKMLDKLMIDFPVFNDKATCTGYVSKSFKQHPYIKASFS